MNWDQLKYVLAVSRGGSLLAGASLLEVNQSTVSRRLRALEDTLNSSLFIRSSQGLVPTETGELLIHHAERVESEVLALQEKVEKKAQQPTGTVRISTMPWIFQYLIVPALPDFQKKYPRIKLLAISGARERRLGSREAELALRFEMPAHSDETCIEIATITYSVYASKEKSNISLPWVGYMDDPFVTAPVVWQETSRESDEPLVFMANDAGIVYQAVRNGIGKALLPDLLAAQDPKLVRISATSPELLRTLRILVHNDMQSIARIAVVLDWLKGFGLKTPNT